MARIRTIKPEFWTDGDVMDLTPYARLLFIGSWNFALCDFGHVADDPRRLKMQVLPSDDVDADALVAELVDAGRMVRIEVDGRSFLHIKRFTDHQKTEKRWTPRCPVCASTNPAEPLPTSPKLSETPRTSAPERKGKERTGREGEKTPRAQRSDTDDRFDEFWSIYDHKVGRKKAETAWSTALKKPGVTADLLIAAAHGYIAWQANEGKHPQFTKHASTWLNGEHWRDERVARLSRPEAFLASARRLHDRQLEIGEVS